MLRWVLDVFEHIPDYLGFSQVDLDGRRHLRFSHIPGLTSNGPRWRPRNLQAELRRTIGSSPLIQQRQPALATLAESGFDVRFVEVHEARALDAPTMSLKIAPSPLTPREIAFQSQTGSDRPHARRASPLPRRRQPQTSALNHAMAELGAFPPQYLTARTAEDGVIAEILSRLGHRGRLVSASSAPGDGPLWAATATRL